MVSTRKVRVEADISDKKRDRLEQVETVIWAYLGSMISENGGTDEEVCNS